jgi:hypothetical protein
MGPSRIEFLQKFTISCILGIEISEQNARQLFNMLEKPGNRGSRYRSLVEDSSGSLPGVPPTLATVGRVRTSFGRDRGY